MSDIADMTLEEAMGDKWRPGVHYVSQAEARMAVMAAEIERLRAVADTYREGLAELAIRERDEARAMVKELIAEVRTLLEPMNELLTKFGDDPEADRVFPQYEFDALRTLIVKAEAMS